MQTSFYIIVIFKATRYYKSFLYNTFYGIKIFGVMIQIFCRCNFYICIVFHQFILHSTN